MRKRTATPSGRPRVFASPPSFLMGVGAVPATAASDTDVPDLGGCAGRREERGRQEGGDRQDRRPSRTAAVAVRGIREDRPAGRRGVRRGRERTADRDRQQPTKLDAQAAAAKKKATEAAREAGQLAAQLAREGYGNIGLDLFLNGKKAGNLLDVLGTMNNLGESSDHIFAVAEQEHRQPRSLSMRRHPPPRQRRPEKAAAGESRLLGGHAAANAAEAKVNSQTSAADVLTAQLASLNGTTASIEAQYLAGVAWEAKQAAQKPRRRHRPAASREPSRERRQPRRSHIAIAFAERSSASRTCSAAYGPNDWDCSG